MAEKPKATPLSIALGIIGALSFAVGIALDVDSRAMQAQISSIAETVRDIGLDQKVQDKIILANTWDIEYLKQTKENKRNE